MYIQIIIKEIVKLLGPSLIKTGLLAKTLSVCSDSTEIHQVIMNLCAIAAGLVLIFSIARHEALKNQNQINLLKVLGAGTSAIRAITLLEFGFTGCAAALAGVGLSFCFSYAGAWYFFDSLWRFDPNASILIPGSFIGSGPF